ncbi:nucleotidyltransferase domain-containing protein [Candidatus Woesearchaeota archaeon]|jgi:predicted nucleotidyltransferase|nr:nucleotidyltransferase domain-containing protein [Candidatus Woesearchaeota archaeon]MBT3538379.1 nucleotidyltransferase domain-containing protein [Candidatus Woesearchaeota archaeon]MBT4697046.1 nucleotidyltransferase domain-containing protein [Candidatus Woesearchaeota archaeon]MBT4717177.1 nucleotidyltransferase domain-containing protein [Candidatus Woesearchaeota archaeon]MBT7106048.1 nucleotidyltransferase domain-containing protein [Candidatus Woesearchaeota archaeon]
MSQKNNINPFKKSTEKILSIIFTHPNRTFHVRNLARLANLSTTSVTKAIKDLESLKIVKVESTDITKNIKANLESDSFTRYKRILNLHQIEKNKLTEIITNELNPSAIVLFGSYAKGEDIEESDIDIVTISNKKSTKELEKSLEKTEKALKRKISLQILPSLEKSSKEFKNAIINGIVLQGYIKVV